MINNNIKYGTWVNVFPESKFSGFEKIKLNESFDPGKEKLDYNSPPKVINQLKSLRLWAKE